MVDALYDVTSSGWSHEASTQLDDGTLHSGRSVAGSIARYNGVVLQGTRLVSLGSDVSKIRLRYTNRVSNNFFINNITFLFRFFGFTLSKRISV